MCFTHERRIRKRSIAGTEGENIGHNMICSQQSFTRIEAIAVFDTATSKSREHNCIVSPYDINVEKAIF